MENREDYKQQNYQSGVNNRGELKGNFKPPLVTILIISFMILGGVVLLSITRSFTPTIQQPQSKDQTASRSTTNPPETVLDYKKGGERLMLCGDGKIGLQSLNYLLVHQLGQEQYQTTIKTFNRILSKKSSFHLISPAFAQELGRPLYTCTGSKLRFKAGNDYIEESYITDCRDPYNTTLDYSQMEKSNKLAIDEIGRLEKYTIDSRSFGFLAITDRIKISSWPFGGIPQGALGIDLVGFQYQTIIEEIDSPRVFVLQGQLWELKDDLTQEELSAILRGEPGALNKKYHFSFTALEPALWDGSFGKFEDGLFIPKELHPVIKNYDDQNIYITEREVGKLKAGDYLFRISLDYSQNFNVLVDDSFCSNVSGKSIEQLSVQEYTPFYINKNQSIWRQESTLPRGRYYHAAAAGNGYLFISGGLSFRNYELGRLGGSLERIQSILAAKIDSRGNLGGWREVGNLPVPLLQHAMMEYGGRLYFSGGEIRAKSPDEENSKEVFSYKINADGSLTDHREEKPLPEGRMAHRMETYGDIVIVFDGSRSSWATEANNKVLLSRLNKNGEIIEWKVQELDSIHPIGGGIIRDRLYVTEYNKSVSYKISDNLTLTERRVEVVPSLEGNSGRGIGSNRFIFPLDRSKASLQDWGGWYTGEVSASGISNFHEIENFADVGSYAVAQDPDTQTVYIVSGMVGRQKTLDVREVWSLRQ
ncbi:MAG: hypothetical protein G01um101431_950 [Parcubacteria group bacterium Gr01-1014_31]|nr:MAG: hypothetical protein G01um101431_950 [Parcubacteria group bacterium Gr01-1014_31]